MQEKVLLVGDDSYEMYVKALYNGFLRMGYMNTRLFATNRFIEDKTNLVSLFFFRLENKLAFGPKISKLNRELLACIKEYAPELVFFYSTRLIYPKTIKKIKHLGITVFLYNNDDPFADNYPKYFWRHYRNGLQYADVGFVYRFKNIDEYKNVGCNCVKMLRAYYIKERNYCLPEIREKDLDVVFLGHYEEDERGDYIRALASEGITVGITDRTWEEFETGNTRIIKLQNCHERYNELLNRAKIAIVFLSKINNDTYTRRCFEIPATKVLMVSPYTEDLASMFLEDKEVIFYRNREEFVDKIKYYLQHDEKRLQIANNGYMRLIQDGHEVGDRVKYIMKWYEDLFNEKNYQLQTTKKNGDIKTNGE